MKERRISQPSTLNPQLKLLPGSVTAPRGFRAAGVFCDIKRLGTGKGSDKGQKKDLALIVSEVPATVAGMFTTNQVQAAPVKVCLRCISGGVGQALVANSGNANACSGKQGFADAQEMARAAAGCLGLNPKHILVASTGRIGLNLPMRNVVAGIKSAAPKLGASARHAADAAVAIMTSDTRSKQCAVQFKIGGKTACIGAIAKGAGMIHPGMSPSGKRPVSRPTAPHATLLVFITTDAAVERRALQEALREAVAQSFNRITVDGDMSTNDSVVILANGLAGNRRLTYRDLATFQSALNCVCLELARMVVRDGEGVHRVVTVRLQGAANAAEADAAARAVANSALVKTSWHGGDPNWGRIIDALGYSTAKVIEHKVDIGYAAPGGKKVLWSLKRGRPTKATFQALCAAAALPEFDLHIHLNLGRGSAVIYACDLTEAYVEFNKGDVTDQASLGG